MPVLKYRDPADGLWKPVPVGGSSTAAPNEVTVDATEPTDGSELWLDTDEPATGGADLWVNTTGDSMTGQLGLVAPTVLTNAARWADGIPRFNTRAARDAAYLAIGGAQAGMRCTLGHVLYRWDGTQWVTFYEGEALCSAPTYASGGTHVVFDEFPGNNAASEAAWLPQSAGGFEMPNGLNGMRNVVSAFVNNPNAGTVQLFVALTKNLVPIISYTYYIPPGATGSLYWHSMNGLTGEAGPWTLGLYFEPNGPIALGSKTQLYTVAF